jgi:hypothetical protein
MRFFIAFVSIVAPIKIASSNTEIEVCTLFLGESTIKNAGWGVFAGRPFKAGDQVVRIMFWLDLPFLEESTEDTLSHSTQLHIRGTQASVSKF